MKTNLTAQIEEEETQKLKKNVQQQQPLLPPPPPPPLPLPLSTSGPISNNPFGDSFSQLNDNDLFGLEFDRIRQTNSNQNLMQPDQLKLGNNNLNFSNLNNNPTQHYKTHHVKSVSCSGISLTLNNNNNTNNSRLNDMKPNQPFLSYYYNK